MNSIPEELLEQLCAYIDGELTQAEKTTFEATLASNPALQREADLMGATKNVVRSRADQLRTPMPVELQRSIRMALANEVNGASESTNASFLDTIAQLIRKPAFAFTAMIAFAVGVSTVIINETSDNGEGAVAASLAPFDLYNASYENFESIVKGDLEVTMASDDPGELAKFFAEQGVMYNVFFPEMDAELKGGVVSEHNGRKFAHIVYGAGDHLVYIFEVDRESVEKNVVALNPVIASDIEESRWHWEDKENVGTMFVWESNNIICSAVSDLRTQDFSALFTLEKL